jgi:hypothetical protein
MTTQTGAHFTPCACADSIKIRGQIPASSYGRHGAASDAATLDKLSGYRCQALYMLQKKWGETTYEMNKQINSYGA